jgi:AcrR family transcriptional regulator
VTGPVYAPVMAKLPRALARTPVGEERISPEAHADERRREILDLVVKVFAKRGYHGATIDHLVTGGNTSMGGFYKLFEGKEDCFVQAFDLVVDQAEAGVAKATTGADDWGGEVSAGLLSLLDFVAAEPFAARLVLIEAQSGGDEALRHYTRLLAAAAAILRAGRSESAATIDLPESFEEATVSGVVWSIQNRLARGEAINPAELHPQLAKMVLEPYLGRKRMTSVLRRSETGR